MPKQKKTTVQIRSIIGQFFFTLGNLRSAGLLIRDYQLWTGVNRYGWVFKVLVVVAVLMGFSFLSMVTSWIGSLFQAESGMAALSSVGTFASNLFTSGYESFTSGMLKYVILLLSEVIIFHFMQRALEELEEHELRTDFQTFLDAQIRMIIVVIRIYIMELIATLLVSIFFGIFGFLSWLEPFANFFIQCYFFGLVILDNYNEQYGLKISTSLEMSKNYRGVSLALGMVLYLFMLVPLVGVIAGTILVSLTAVIVLNKIAKIDVDSLNASHQANPTSNTKTE